MCGSWRQRQSPGVPPQLFLIAIDRNQIESAFYTWEKDGKRWREGLKLIRSCSWEDATPSPSPNFCFQKKGKEEQRGQKYQPFTTTLAPKGAVVSASSRSLNSGCYCLAVVTGPFPTQKLFFDLSSSLPPLRIGIQPSEKAGHYNAYSRRTKTLKIVLDLYWSKSTEWRGCCSIRILLHQSWSWCSKQCNQKCFSLCLVKLPFSILRRWASDYSQFAWLPIIPHPIITDFFLCWSR